MAVTTKEVDRPKMIQKSQGGVLWRTRSKSNKEEAEPNANKRYAIVITLNTARGTTAQSCGMYGGRRVGFDIGRHGWELFRKMKPLY